LGTDDNVNVGDINAVDGTAYLSVSAWIKQNSLIHEKSIVSKWAASNHLSFFTVSSDPNDITVEIVGPGGLNACRASTTGNIHRANVWEHWAFVFDGTEAAVDANSLKIFKDGIKQTLSFGNPGCPSTTESNSNVIRIGSHSDLGAASFWNGLIDDARIYNRALSAGELNKLYQMGR
jgi:Concanavalin A-like lectin/glucanases superfamily